MDFQRDKKTKKYFWLSSSEIPAYDKQETLNSESCICDRKRGLIVCNKCKNSFVGRIGMQCPVHPEILFLMDARNCAFCQANVKDLRMAD